MDEELLNFAYKILGYLTTMRSAGQVVIGQAVFASRDGKFRVVVTNNDGTYELSQAYDMPDELPPLKVVELKQGNKPMHERQTDGGYSYG